MDWVCSGCGRHFNWSVSECPYCRHQTTITTGGTQPTSNQQIKDSISLLITARNYLSLVSHLHLDLSHTRDAINMALAKLNPLI